MTGAVTLVTIFDDMVKSSTMPMTENHFISVARDIVPLIEQHASLINRERQLTEKVSGPMADAGLFRLLIPKSRGGYEIDYLEFLKIVSIIAQADGSVAWCLNQNNVLSTLSAFMPDSLAEEIWAERRAVLSNGPPVNPNAVPGEDGYVLNGRWNFSSGSRHATWRVALTPVEGRKGPNGQSEMRNMIVPADWVEMEDTWQVNGLRGTGSFSFLAHDLFVPERLTFIDGGLPEVEGPLYKMPKSLLFCSGFATTALGVARSGLDSVIGLSRAKTPQEQELLMKQPFTQREIGQAEAIWRSANAYLSDSAESAWHFAVTEGEIPVEDRINLRLSSTHAIREAVKVADIAYSLTGSSAIFEQTAIQRK
ncbi:MAG: acyl-CoA dehydrogenase family protein, partial [Chloroflexota bacterium]|nr:acyl-CoA dehydrogenase family protein [Chloroflexota bacterium]